jgi:hypothetical protein
MQKYDEAVVDLEKTIKLTTEQSLAEKAAGDLKTLQDRKSK